MTQLMQSVMAQKGYMNKHLLPFWKLVRNNVKHQHSAETQKLYLLKCISYIS